MVSINSYKHVSLSPLLHLLMPHSGLLLSHCLLVQVSVALKKGQNILFIGAGITEDIFHYLQYHCLFPLFIHLLQPCSKKFTWSRLFPTSGGNFVILWEEGVLIRVKRCTSCLAVGEDICTRCESLKVVCECWLCLPFHYHRAACKHWPMWHFVLYCCSWTLGYHGLFYYSMSLMHTRAGKPSIHLDPFFWYKSMHAYM